MSGGATWTHYSRRGFAFVADRGRRIAWSFTEGRLAVITPAGVSYGEMGIGAARGRGRRSARAMRPARAAEATRPAQPARPSQPERR